MPTIKYKRKKGLQIMLNGSNCDRKSQLSGILTEPLNPRDMEINTSNKFIIFLKGTVSIISIDPQPIIENNK